MTPPVASTPVGSPSGVQPQAGQPQPVQPQPVQQVVMPRWGYQASFIQRRQPAFWLFVVLLAITGLVVVGRELEFINVRATAWFFSIPLLILYVAPLLAAIYVLDLFEREPISLLVAAFLWGGVIAIGFAGMTNTAWLQIIQKIAGPDFARDWGPALIGPSVEETLKGLGIVALFLIARSEFDDVFDGFVYGAVIGLGFAAVEDLDYFVRLSAANDQIGSVLYVFFIRVVSSGLYGHVLYTGLVGMGFAYFVSRRDQPYQRRVQVAVGAVALAWLAHFIWNSPIFSFLVGDGGLVNWFVTATIKGLPMLAAFAFLVYLAQKREARWFAYATARETGTDLLSVDEVAELSDLRTRRTARKRVLAKKGPAAEKLMGRLQHEQINLAMVRTRVASEDDPDLVRQRETIRAVRAQLLAMPDLPPPVFAPAAPVQTGVPGGYPQAGALTSVPSSTPSPAWAPTSIPAAGVTTAARSTDQPGASTSTAQPGPSTAQPEASTTQPIVSTPTAQPGASTLQPGPSISTAEPEASTAQPTPTVQPQASTAQPVTSTPTAEPHPGVQPQASTAQPVTSTPTAEPQASTAQPTPTVQPQASTAEPEASTTQPEASTAERQASTAQPTPTVQPQASTAEPEASTARPTPTVQPVASAAPSTAATGPVAATPAAATPAASTPAFRQPTSLFATTPTPASTPAATPVSAPQTLAVWQPTHLVPAGGMQAWASPDPSRAPIAMLAERLDLRVVERAADWAHVVASNGWSGWVDGRRLIQIAGT